MARVTNKVRFNVLRWIRIFYTPVTNRSAMRSLTLTSVPCLIHLPKHAPDAFVRAVSRLSNLETFSLKMLDDQPENYKMGKSNQVVYPRGSVQHYTRDTAYRRCVKY